MTRGRAAAPGRVGTPGPVPRRRRRSSRCSSSSSSAASARCSSPSTPTTRPPRPSSTPARSSCPPCVGASSTGGKAVGGQHLGHRRHRRAASRRRQRGRRRGTPRAGGHDHRAAGRRTSSPAPTCAVRGRAAGSGLLGRLAAGAHPGRERGRPAARAQPRRAAGPLPGRRRRGRAGAALPGAARGQRRPPARLPRPRHGGRGRVRPGRSPTTSSAGPVWSSSTTRSCGGPPGRTTVSVDARGLVTGVVSRVDPVPGRDLVTSIDAGVQAATEKALAGRWPRRGPGGCPPTPGRPSCST